MAAVQEMLDKLPSMTRKDAVKRGERGTPRPARKGPEIVVNDIDVTMVFTAPFAFALPKRLVSWLLERFKVGDVQVTVSSTEGKLPKPSKPATRRTVAPRTARKPARKAA